MQTIWNSIVDLGHGFLAWLPKLGIGLFCLLATIYVARYSAKLLRRGLRHTRLRESLVELFAKLAYIASWVVGILVISMALFEDITPSKLLTVMGLGSVAIGFAFKDIFENFLAGILVLVREPFELGDFIECEGLEGMVEEISIRDTHIRKPDGQRVVIPNAQLFKSPVTVRTDRALRRISLEAGVAYGEDVDEAREVIREAVATCETVADAEPVQVFAESFADSAVVFDVRWWTRPTPGEVARSRDEVLSAVKRALDDSGIEIPFPYRTLTFHEPLALQSNDADAEQPARAAA